MIKRYRFYRRHQGRFISLTLAPDPALFWGVVGCALAMLLGFPL